MFEGGHNNVFFSSFSFFFVVVVIVLVILGSAAMQKEEMYLRKKHLIVTLSEDFRCGVIPCFPVNSSLEGGRGLHFYFCLCVFDF